jgi:hypothetical protein
LKESRVVHHTNFGHPTSATGQNPNASRTLGTSSTANLLMPPQLYQGIKV